MAKVKQKCNVFTSLVCPQVALFCTSFWILMFSLDRFGVCAVDISQLVNPVQWFPCFCQFISNNKTCLCFMVVCLGLEVSSSKDKMWWSCVWSKLMATSCIKIQKKTSKILKDGFGFGRSYLNDPALPTKQNVTNKIAIIWIIQGFEWPKAYIIAMLVSCLTNYTTILHSLLSRWTRVWSI